MIRQMWNSRAARKFRRNRLAVAAFVVIAFYLLVGASVLLFGLITLDETGERVGMKNVPGFFAEQRAEKRMNDCEYFLDIVDRALGKRDPEEALAAIRFGRLDLIDKPVDDIREIVDQGWKIYDELAEIDDLNEAPGTLPRLGELQSVVAELFPIPTGWDGFIYKLQMCLGTDRAGRSISFRAIYSIKVAFQIGMVTAVIAVALGSVLGTAAGFFGGWVDHLVTWLFTTFSSIPNLVLLVLLAYMFAGTVFDGTLVPVYIAFSCTFWIGPCRVIRGETLKLKELEYVQAATAIGFGRGYILFRHILPNAVHLILINFSLLFIGAIKSEVILTFLGLGVKSGPSLGIMITQSRSEVINGFFWQIGTATVVMFILVLAFNILSDALQDAFDPKHL